MTLRYLLGSLICLSLLSALAAQPAETDPASPTPASRVRPRLLVLPAAWATRLPPSHRVNVPEFLETLYPGQKCVFALSAVGPDRDKLLEKAELTLKVTANAYDPVSFKSLKPQTHRSIKSEGADISLRLLKAGGIAKEEMAKIEKETSQVSLTVFEGEWTAPDVAASTAFQLVATVSGVDTPVDIEAAALTVRPLDEWFKDPQLSDEALEKQLGRYHGTISPSLLASHFRTISQSKRLKDPTTYSFLIMALRENREARDVVVKLYPYFDSDTKEAVLVVLGLAGQDAGALIPGLQPDVLTWFATLKPIADPRTQLQFSDPVSPQAVAALGANMDLCWSGWTTTGDASYLKALTVLLAGAPDFQAFQSWQEKRGGIQGLNAAVARGLGYQIAGWSIESFLRTDPLVSDWLEYWETDTALPETVRNEIRSLPGNKNFRRK